MKQFIYIIAFISLTAFSQHDTMLLVSQQQYNNESSNLQTETVYEAEENFTNVTLSGGNEWTLAFFTAGYNGSGFLRVPTGVICGTFSATCGARADYVFDIPATGDYYLHVRVYAENSGKDSFHFGWDETFDSTHNGITTGAWTWYTTGSVNLTAGTHTLNIWNRDLDFRIDQLEVSTSATP